MSDLQSFLNQRFKGHKCPVLGKLLEPIKHGQIMPPGSLVLMPGNDTTLRLKILEQPTPHKGFSEPLVLKEDASQTLVTPSYLVWYFNIPEVQEHLLKSAKGVVFVRIARQALHSLPIPLPRRAFKTTSIGEVVLRSNAPRFRNQINEFYADFQRCLKIGSRRTAVVLAGAISEMLLFQWLLDHEVDEKLLKDNNVGFKVMMDYVRLLKLHESPGFPLTNLEKLSKARNRAIHAGRLLEDQPITHEELEQFDDIIRFFGI